MNKDLKNIMKGLADFELMELNKTLQISFNLKDDLKRHSLTNESFFEELQKEGYLNLTRDDVDAMLNGYFDFDIKTISKLQTFFSRKQDKYIEISK